MTIVCVDCQSLETVLAELPVEWAKLDASPGGSVGQRVSGTRTPPVPGRLDALSLLGVGTIAVHGELGGGRARLVPVYRTRAEVETVKVGDEQVEIRIWTREQVYNPDGTPRMVPDGDQTGDIPPLVMLDSWVSDWLELGAPGHHKPRATMDRLCQWLTDRLDWACRNHPAMPDFGEEVRQALATLKRLNGEPSSWKALGPCPNIVDDNTGRRCGQMLMANPRFDVIRCRTCRAQWERRRWLWLGQLIRSIEGDAA